MKTIRLLILLLISSFISCESGNETGANSDYDNDMETIGHWAENPKVTREASHSGKYATFTDTTNIYSQTLSLTVKDIKQTEIKSIYASCWVLNSSQESKGKLVLSVEKEGKNIVWQGIETNKSTYVANKWSEVKMQVDLKEKLTGDMVIKLYGVNDGKFKIYWDDFNIDFK
jgi:hypothetical protein